MVRKMVMSFNLLPSITSFNKCCQSKNGPLKFDDFAITKIVFNVLGIKKENFPSNDFFSSWKPINF